MQTNLQIIHELKEFLMQASTQNEKYCNGATSFTRHRILDFSTVVLFITNLIKKSLAIELTELFDIAYHKNPVPTKGAFSQARYKLKAPPRRSDFFQDWNHCLVRAFYRINTTRVKRWRGFRVFGIDGSKASLPNHTLVREEFGLHANQAKKFPMAQLMVCYDVLNQLCFTSCIDRSACDEISVAIDWVAHLPEDSLTIYDRGYTSFTLLYLLSHYQKAFVIRC